MNIVELAQNRRIMQDSINLVSLTRLQNHMEQAGHEGNYDGISREALSEEH